MWMIGKLRQAFRENGISGLLSRSLGFLYRRLVRPLSPARRPLRWGGVPICHLRKWTDLLVPDSWHTERLDDPIYEAGLVGGLNAQVRPGDRVVVVGGGVGVTAVTAALCAGPSGRIECYEGSAENCGHVRATAALNGVALGIHHAVVGEPIAVYHDPAGFGAPVAPAALPPCDVLCLDCEGAEVTILRELPFRPRVLLVETHGVYKAPSVLVAAMMRERGYAVTDLGWAEPRFAESCRRDDIRVLLGTAA